jgi:hypothetical protein
MFYNDAKKVSECLIADIQEKKRENNGCGVVVVCKNFFVAHLSNNFKGIQVSLCHKYSKIFLKPNTSKL